MGHDFNVYVKVVDLGHGGAGCLRRLPVLTDTPSRQAELMLQTALTYLTHPVPKHLVNWATASNPRFPLAGQAASPWPPVAPIPEPPRLSTMRWVPVGPSSSSMDPSFSSRATSNNVLSFGSARPHQKSSIVASGSLVPFFRSARRTRSPASSLTRSPICALNAHGKRPKISGDHAGWAEQPSGKVHQKPRLWFKRPG